MSSLFKPALEKVRLMESKNIVRNVVEMGFHFNPVQPSHQTLQAFQASHNSPLKVRNPSLKIYWERQTIQPWSSPFIHIQMANRDQVKMECEGLSSCDITQIITDLDAEYDGLVSSSEGWMRFLDPYNFGNYQNWLNYDRYNKQMRINLLRPSRDKPQMEYSKII